MKKRIELEQKIEALVEANQPLPVELKQAVEQDDELQCYYQSLLDLFKIFDETSAPNVPAGLTQEVMAFITEQELQVNQNKNSILQDAWLAIQEFFQAISLPPVLKRDAWPTAFASLVIVWSVFIAPQVQADKLNQIVDHPWIVTVDQYTERVYQKSGEAADRLIQFTEGLIPFAVEKTSQSESKSESEKTPLTEGFSSLNTNNE